MIPLTPLFSRYRDSYFLFTFRYMDLIRSSPSKELALILSKELTYLYHIACLITYKDIQEQEIDQLREWLLSLPQTMTLEQMKTEFSNKMEQLNLRAPQPKNYAYTFTTIWDSIHFLCLLIDDMVESREKYDNELIRQHLRLMKPVFYNVFFKLNCPMCRNHYLTIKGYLIMQVERIEVALYREKYGEKIVMVDEMRATDATENVLMRHGMLYASMMFHNHVNDYRWIQRNVQPPVQQNTQRMDWTTYKNLLQLK
ncbi:hypothetical protein [Helicoverpa armigera NPV NNg1]|uniref:P33 n=1 Tax=Helicoverpa armigera NPV NNg1 TaxID=566972 RepID=B5X077_9ABAC|nr:hypothetical protein [Helicoverpa armigera NPV NNg1]